MPKEVCNFCMKVFVVHISDESAGRWNALSKIKKEHEEKVSDYCSPECLAKSQARLNKR